MSTNLRPSVEEVFTTLPPPIPESTTLLANLFVLDEDDWDVASTSTVAPPLEIVNSGVEARVDELIFR